jgi:hypothetical protein
MMLRYFCLVAAGQHGDLGYAYLRALEATSIRVRALPIGPASAIGTEKRWYELGGLFTTPMSIPFVNIVCAPCGLMLGTRAPMKALGGTSDLAKQDGQTRDVMVFPPELRAVLGPQKDAPEAVYEPQTAFSGLHTSSCSWNVAIVTDDFRDDPSSSESLKVSLSESEVRALERYDQVICAHDGTARILASRGVRAVHLAPPDDELEVLELEGLCSPSDTTATTARSAATAARPAITWLRSTPSTASSSRSPSSETRSPRQSRDTSTSTDSPSPGSESPPKSLTWRSIIRRLAFWRS